jgi:hypothetical protein
MPKRRGPVNALRSAFAPSKSFPRC